MANLFDSTNAPEGQPLEVVVGDFIQWKRSDLVSDYPSASYSAEYVARVSQGGSSEIKIAGVGSATEYLFTVDSATSSAFDAGFYHWQLEVTETSSGNRIVVQRGEFKAVVDLDVNGTDPRTHSEVMLDKIETILEGKADSDVSNYSIAGRSLTKMTFDELMVARDRYRQEVLAYRRKIMIQSGKASGTTVKVRFS
tara:strand:- start:6067 stop:6654 length:588 start_codon:yes stop_codon:yes gene_type:complete